MSDTRVDAVIAVVGRGDAALAERMRLAAGGLAGGGGAEVITQAGLQQFLWYGLPRRHPDPDEPCQPLAEATAVLLALLDLDRYAAIARSTTTGAVLDAWEQGPSLSRSVDRSVAA